MGTYDHLLSTPMASDATQGAVFGEKDKFYKLPSGRWRKINRNGIDGSIGLAREIALTSLQEDFLVNHSVKPERERVHPMNATCGPKCLELYESSARHGSSLKTCVAYLLSSKEWYSNKCALTWKEKVTTSNRLLFQLAPSMLRTEGTECGLSPTATTGDRRSKNSKQQGINNVIEGLIPTPLQPGNGGTNGKKKMKFVMGMIPTPATRDWKGSATQGRDTVDSLVERMATKGECGEKTGLKLQPAFVEWMMGYPEKWTELPCPKPGTEPSVSKPSETQSSRKWRYKFLED